MRIQFAVLLAIGLFGCRNRANSDLEQTQSMDPSQIDFEETENVAKGIGDIFRFNYGPRNKNKPIPAVRAAFRRTLGCARAEFTVLPLNDELYQKGKFSSPEKFDAWVRLSRDRTAPVGEDDFDKATTAMSIKVLPRKGGNQPPTEPVDGEHDFILQNHPVFFAKTAKEFLLAFWSPKTLSPENLEKLKSVLKEKVSEEDRKRINKILDEMEKDVGNVLRKTVWSVTPYRFVDTFDKYRIVPIDCKSGQPILADEDLPKEVNQNEYLKDRLVRDLKVGPACFNFQVQLYADPQSTPLDDATVYWDETKFVPRTVAALKLLKQDVSLTHAACEKARFTPWHSPDKHEPVGSINYARRFIYDRFADCRKMQNAGAPSPDKFSKQCLPPG